MNKNEDNITSRIEQNRLKALEKLNSKRKIAVSFSSVGQTELDEEEIFEELKCTEQ